MNDALGMRDRNRVDHGKHDLQREFHWKLGTHSLQGLGPDGCEFLLAFDNGEQSEYNTLLVTDWMAHTPPDILAQNFGVPAETFAKIPLHQLYIFQGELPGPLAADQAAVESPLGPPPNPFTFSLSTMP